MLNVVQRLPNFVDLAIPRKAGVTEYRISGHYDLDTAFSAPVPFITIAAGGSFRSPALCKTKRGQIAESNRGLTRVKFDPDDYANPVTGLPADPETIYLVLEEWSTAAGAWVRDGGVKIVPWVGFFNTPRPLLTYQGTAPVVAGVTIGDLPPVGSLWVTMPRMTRWGKLRNQDEDVTLLFSQSPTEQLIELDPEEHFEFFESGPKEILLVSGGPTAVSFTARFAIENGGQ